MLEITNKTKQKINSKTACALTEYVLNFYKKNQAEVSLVIIGDKKMQSLNFEFRSLDKTTDVLSFPAATKSVKTPVNSDFLGEIFINIQEAGRVRKYEELFGELKSKEYIFYFLLIHGLLHLIGYDDKTEKTRRAMITLGEKFMVGFFKKKVL